MGKKILLFAAAMFMRFSTRAEVLGGLEHIPREGAAIMAVNHLGRLEVILMYALAKREDISGWVAEKYRKIPLMTVATRWMEGIWLDDRWVQSQIEIFVP